MQGYKEFSADVRLVFHELIVRYSFAIVSESNSVVILKSEKCILLISTEYGSAQIAFKENETDKWMMLGPYLHVLYPNVTIFFSDNSQKINREAVLCSLKELFEVLMKYGHSFLSGDFSWRGLYEKLISKK